MGVGWGATAEEAQGFERADLVPGAGGNQYRVARPDLALLTVNFH